MKKFKIYFGRYKKNSDYLDVIIYPNKKEYRKHARLFKEFESAAQTFIKIKPDGKCVGRILFDESMFGPAIMAHELQHAVLHYWRFHKKKKINQILKNEEDFCDLSGWLFHWMNKELRKVFI